MLGLRKKLTQLFALLTALALVAAACGGDDPAAGVDPDVSCDHLWKSFVGSGQRDGPTCADVGDLNLVTAGTLTVATGEPAFPPWIGVRRGRSEPCHCGNPYRRDRGTGVPAMDRCR